LHAFEELRLAMEAAIGVVALVLGLVEFVSLDNAERNSLLFGKGLRLFHVAAGKAGRVGEDSEHAAAEDTVGHGSKERGIDSTGVGTDEAAERAQPLFEGAKLCFGLLQPGA